jgi:hypothetical protein
MNYEMKRIWRATGETEENHGSISVSIDGVRGRVLNDVTGETLNLTLIVFGARAEQVYLVLLREEEY